MVLGEDGGDALFDLVGTLDAGLPHDGATARAALSFELGDDELFDGALAGEVDWSGENAFTASLTATDDDQEAFYLALAGDCLLYTSPSPRDLSTSRMPSSA